MHRCNVLLNVASKLSLFNRFGIGRHFNLAEVLDSIRDELVYVHRDPRAKGISKKSQAQDFLDAAISDYFYLTHGNNFVCLLGQFTGPTNFISAKGTGWLDKPFRHIRSSRIKGLLQWAEEMVDTERELDFRRCTRRGAGVFRGTDFGTVLRAQVV
jgi:hypothetical protein